MSTEIDEVEWIDFTVICHTGECVNDGIVITQSAPVDVSAAVCGGCMNPITDITPPLNLSPAE